MTDIASVVKATRQYELEGIYDPSELVGHLIHKAIRELGQCPGVDWSTLRLQTRRHGRDQNLIVYHVVADLRQ